MKNSGDGGRDRHVYECLSFFSTCAYAITRLGLARLRTIIHDAQQVWGAGIML